jgi:hypothetical protein
MRLRGAFVVRFALAVVLVLAVFGSIGIIRPTAPADAMPGEKPFLDAGRTQPPRKWRLVITMQKVGDGYKASQVQFLQ